MTRASDSKVAEVTYSWAEKRLIRFVMISLFCLARVEMTLQAKQSTASRDLQTRHLSFTS